MATVERIDYPAPLPEEPADELLTEILALAPYEVPEKKAKKKAPGTRTGLHRKGTSDVTSKDTETHSSTEDNEEEGEDEEIHPSYCREKEEEGLHTWGGRGVQEGENFPPGRLHSGHRQQLGMAPQGQAPGQIMSNQKPGHIHISDLVYFIVLTC